MYRRGDLGQVARAIRVLDSLRGFRNGRSLADLASEVGVSVRTIRRDIAELVDAGFEIALTSIEGGPGARLVERSHSTVPITRRERYTLLAVRSVFDVLRGTPLHDDIASVLAKLEQRMSPEERAEYETFGSRFAYVPDGGTKLYAGREDVIDALQTGILSRRLIKFSYSGTRRRAKHSLLAPYCMLLYRHGLYVVGSTIDNGAPGTPDVYAAERFETAEAVRGTRFDVPRDFNVDETLHGAFGIHIGGSNPTRVVVDFDAEKAPLVRARLWHATQQLAERPGGGVRLEFTCVNTAPVLSWVLEWGPHARVVAPQELVEEVRTELKAALAQYS